MTAITSTGSRAPRSARSSGSPSPSGSPRSSSIRCGRCSADEVRAPRPPCGAMPATTKPGVDATRRRWTSATAGGVLDDQGPPLSHVPPPLDGARRRRAVRDRHRERRPAHARRGLDRPAGRGHGVADQREADAGVAELGRDAALQHVLGQARAAVARRGSSARRRRSTIAQPHPATRRLQLRHGVERVLQQVAEDGHRIGLGQPVRQALVAAGARPTRARSRGAAAAASSASSRPATTWCSTALETLPYAM